MERKIDEHIRIFSLCSSEPIGAAAQKRDVRIDLSTIHLKKSEYELAVENMFNGVDGES